MRHLNRIGWETIQNLPMVVGFVASAHFFLEGERGIGAAISVLSMSAGAVLIQTTEARMSLKSTPTMAANATIFSFLALVALFYFDGISWHYDIVCGVMLGLIMTAAQAIAERENIVSAFQHAIAMVIGCGLIMLVMRNMINLSLPHAILVSTTLTVIVSAIIVFLDYDVTTSSDEVAK